MRDEGVFGQVPLPRQTPIEEAFRYISAGQEPDETIGADLSRLTPSRGRRTFSPWAQEMIKIEFADEIKNGKISAGDVRCKLLDSAEMQDIFVRELGEFPEPVRTKKIVDRVRVEIRK